MLYKKKNMLTTRRFTRSQLANRVVNKPILSLKEKAVLNTLEGFFEAELNRKEGRYLNPETRRLFALPNETRRFIKQQVIRRIRAKSNAVDEESVITTLQEYYDTILEREGDKLRNPHTKRWFKIPRTKKALRRLMLPKSSNLVRIRKTTALNKSYTCYTYEPESWEGLRIDDKIDMDAYSKFFIEHIKPRIIDKIKNKLKKNKTVKVVMTHGFSGKDDDKTHHAGDKAIIISNTDNMDFSIVEKHIELILSLSYFMPYTAYTKVDIAAYTLNGSSFVPIPKELAAKKCIVNVKNKDNRCFMWAILAAHAKLASNAERVNNYVNMTDLYKWPKFPVDIADLDEWEKINGVGVSVYGWDRNEEKLTGAPTVLRVSKIPEPYNLLLHDEHYSWIRNLNRFSSSTGIRRYNCATCLRGFRDNKAKDKHEEQCVGDSQIEEMPAENELKHKIDYKSARHPIVIYADFEALNVPTTHRKADTRHMPCSFGIYTVTDPGFDYQSNKYVMERSTPETFVRYLLSKEQEISKALTAEKTVNMTEKDEVDYEKAKVCYLCPNKGFSAGKYSEDLIRDGDYETSLEKLASNILYDKDNKYYKNEEMRNEAKEVLYRKVKDHCQMTGKYRGLAHAACSCKVKAAPLVVPVFFHNASGYDIHHIIRAISNMPEAKNMKMSGISLNNEKMKTFKFGIFHISDSLAFLPSSLSTLLNNLDFDKKTKLQKHFGDKCELLMQKQIYPYEWHQTVEQFDGPIPLKKHQYYSSLTRSHPSTEDMEHLGEVIKTLDIKTFGEYHDTYLAVDVLGLVDVFEEFRKIAFNQYGQEIAHFISLPSYAWASMMKKTEVTLELIKDKTMYEFFERGIRGGVSMIVNRHAVANNPQMATYDKEKEESSIRYYDSNNLYGLSMTQPLPISGFRWTDSPRPDEGYTAEVDLEYPEHLHDLHNDLPLAPENMEVKEEIISHYSKDVLVISGKKFTKSRKLIGHLGTRKNYVVNSHNLNYYISMGIKVTKIHRCIAYKEEAWLKPWIDQNTAYRTEAKNNFEKDFYKLMNNATFGKTMENVRGRTNIKFNTTEKDFRRQWSDPALTGSIPISENLVITFHEKRTVKLNKPIYAGQAILDLSKLTMYKFHYGYIKPKWPEAKLCMTDTDSLCYHIKTKNLDSQLDPSWFDCSELPKSHPLFSIENKKVPGKMKDEAQGKEITEFVGHRSKVYAMTIEGGKEVCKCKGVPKATVKNDLNINVYREVLEKEESKVLESTRFRSFNHQIFTVTASKVALSAYDDKRYMLPSGMDSLAYGHYKIEGLRKIEEARVEELNKIVEMRLEEDQRLADTYEVSYAVNEKLKCSYNINKRKKEIKKDVYLSWMQERVR